MGLETAAIIALAGVATSAASAGMSFAQAGKQRKLQQEAERDAKQAMEEAKKKLEINYLEQLAIQKEPYQLEREALLSAGAQGVLAAQEGEARGAAPGVGRIQLAQQQGQRQIAGAMGQELLGLEKAAAQEEGRIRDALAGLDLAEVTGAQLAAREAQRAAAAATQSGFSSLQAAGQQAIQMAPLYGKNIEAEKAAIGQMSFTPQQKIAFEKAGGLPSALEGGDLNFQTIGALSNPQYRQFINQLTPMQRQMLFANNQFQQLYNPFNPFR